MQRCSWTDWSVSVSARSIDSGELDFTSVWKTPLTCVTEWLLMSVWFGWLVLLCKQTGRADLDLCSTCWRLKLHLLDTNTLHSQKSLPLLACCTINSRKELQIVRLMKFRLLKCDKSLHSFSLSHQVLYLEIYIIELVFCFCIFLFFSFVPTQWIGHHCLKNP